MTVRPASTRGGALYSVYAAVFVIALALRLAYVLQIDSAPFSDEADYLACAKNFLAGKGLVMSDQYRAYRAPGYPLFLVPFEAMFADTVRAVRAAQAVIGALACVLAAALAVSVLGSWRWGAALGLACAFFDELIFACGQLLSECLFGCLLLAWLYWIERRRERASPWDYLGWGAMAGAMALVRSAGLLLAALPLLLALGELRAKGWKPAARSALLALAGCAILIAPWTLRNALVLKAFVPLTTNTGVNLYIGHNPHYGAGAPDLLSGYWTTGDKTRIRDMTDLDEVEESHFFSALAKEHIRREPLRTLQNVGVKAYYTFLCPWPRSYAPYGDRPHERIAGPFKPWPWFGQGRELRFAGGVPVPVIPWTAPLFFVALGGLLISLAHARRYAVYYAAILLTLAPYLVFFGRARFRNPLIPLLLLFVLIGAEQVCRAVKARRARRGAGAEPDRENLQGEGGEASEDANREPTTP